MLGAAQSGKMKNALLMAAYLLPPVHHAHGCPFASWWRQIDHFRLLGNKFFNRINTRCKACGIGGFVKCGVLPPSPCTGGVTASRLRGDNKLALTAKKAALPGAASPGACLIWVYCGASEVGGLRAMNMVSRFRRIRPD